MTDSGTVIWIRRDIKQRLDDHRANGQSRCGFIADLLDLYDLYKSALNTEGLFSVKEMVERYGRQTSKASH